MNQLRPRETTDENSVDVPVLRRTPATARTKRRYRGFVLGGLVAVVLVLFTSVVWFAYQDMMPGGDDAPPVVRAEVGPLKRAPSERGGAPVVNEESVVVQALNEPDAPVRVERLIPRDEPAPRSAADVIPDELQAEPAPPEATADASLDSLLSELAEGPTELREIEPADGGAVPSATDERSSQVVPARRPDPEVEAVASPPSAVTAESLEAPAAQPAQASATPPASAASVATAVPERPVASPTPAARTAPAAAGAPARNAGAAPARPATPPTPRTQVAAAPAARGELASSFRLQLLAVRDEAAAAAAWSNLQRQHPAVLGGLRSRVEPANVGGDTFFRLQAGPFQGREAADRACRSLQRAGGDCFIVGPNS